ncbi:Arginine--tRNA ligase [Roseimaritima multifibrata]|uniref:Arginine--tRNA ligase n=1 Tax=Roseimaritima multifibrata TaxID=1930274 RepID=A0A517ME70_9BACT|nr:arginine--tRNA ligase [Roseimaritima multifibrata]QDS93182.1 Arginine--tRNA ligase [Roseimaritima multifibrata]
MHIQSLFKQRLAAALAELTDNAEELSQMVRPTQEPRFGDYQANCAMPLKQSLGIPPREIAEKIVARLQVNDLCDPPEIAGPGFINLRLRDDWIAEATSSLLNDPQLGVEQPVRPRTVLVDYSSPNVAKPMHVGHIRSTVIGDCLSRTLRFLGHHVITDNHLGDWGTQFGMIIYGYKNFADEQAFQKAPVLELLRLYRLVNQFIDYHAAKNQLAGATAGIAEINAQVEAAESAVSAAESAAADKATLKKLRKTAEGLRRKSLAAVASLQSAEKKIADVESDPALAAQAAQHAGIGSAVLEETAKLHRGDSENRELWDKFLPHCADEINRVYNRLGVKFDHTLGESFYHPMLADVVQQLADAGLAVESEGAMCVFLEGFDAPLIVQKKDGAFLYGTTDIATLKYRHEKFQPDEILYVVDSRQSDHFDKLFAVAPKIGLGGIKLVHVQFGTVLGEDGKPLKTRSGSNAGLEELLDDAVAAATEAVCSPERAEKLNPPLTEAEKTTIANVIGHGAIKYADLAHHRASDYRFSLKKMVALEGNTVAYLEYAHARVQGILRAAETDEAAVRNQAAAVIVTEPAERALCLALLRFPEALQQVADDYAPSALVDYLYETARKYMVFNDSCHVMKANDEAIKASRLTLIAVTGRVLRTGLGLLGIDSVDRM